LDHGDVPVLVFEGEYSAALVVRSLLASNGLDTSFDDLPVGGPWRGSESKVFVRRSDEEEAKRLIAGVADT
jgi:hypothetical protein